MSDVAQVAEDVNTISTFLSKEDISDISSIEPVDCIILCVSSVLYSADTIFTALRSRPDLTKALVLCGGVGHSTNFIYEAVAAHPVFGALASEIQGLPEAQVLHAIFRQFFATPAHITTGPRIILEDQSTTCATNATEARKLLDAHGIPSPATVVVVQDPTMVRRTAACFEKAYADLPTKPRFLGCPVFVPLLRSVDDGKLAYAMADFGSPLWSMDRFLKLVMGEIPRLRDDANGYGPRGNGSIAHVDVPDGVEEAWKRLASAIAHRR
ncbi:uncharacterized protein K452DRAFT_322961 [Aplosporella prunicola CBS 121167]|uniref:DUF218 domain-containing protein n=1 Tax=Aplosporella prunicola CBS 121167 TaxID=1176127 RepID=A0A6A6AV96_9PEZI|nr:uncharacterized protein K452DRAFT_322961 [Aplosporella prunicola CBS 121167]KAF2135600.1 hypothetical protein K452DRAFT_322961 [Aplosporella prunicola CBS 121167]